MKVQELEFKAFTSKVPPKPVASYWAARPGGDEVLCLNDYFSSNVSIGAVAD